MLVVPALSRRSGDVGSLHPPRSSRIEATHPHVKARPCVWAHLQRTGSRARQTDRAGGGRSVVVGDDARSRARGSPPTVACSGARERHERAPRRASATRVAAHRRSRSSSACRPARRSPCPSRGGVVAGRRRAARPRCATRPSPSARSAPRASPVPTALVVPRRPRRPLPTPGPRPGGGSSSTIVPAPSPKNPPIVASTGAAKRDAGTARRPRRAGRRAR